MKAIDFQEEHRKLSSRWPMHHKPTVKVFLTTLSPMLLATAFNMANLCRDIEYHYEYGLWS